jgi:hypothetical protein
MTLTALFPLQGAHWRVRQCRFTGGQHAVRIPRFALAVQSYCLRLHACSAQTGLMSSFVSLADNMLSETTATPLPASF